MHYVAVTKYQCPDCKVSLDYSKAFLENGNLVNMCPKCGRHLIIELNVRCPLCQGPATHLSMVFKEATNDGTKVYRKVVRCNYHLDCDDVQSPENNKDGRFYPAYRCQFCGKTIQYKKAFVNVENGMLYATCPQCNNTTSLQNNVKCYYCKEPATICTPSKGLNGQVSGYDFRCETHRNTKSSGCFIATAAYGDEFADEVLVLKKYRDSVLRKTWGGRQFIKLYEVTSPPIARFIANSEILKHITRLLIVNPAAALARYALKDKKN